MINLCSIQSYTAIASETSYNLICDPALADLVARSIEAPSFYLSSYLALYLKQHHDTADVKWRDYFITACKLELLGAGFEAALEAIINLSNAGATVNLVSTFPVEISQLAIIKEVLTERNVPYYVC